MVLGRKAEKRSWHNVWRARMDGIRAEYSLAGRPERVRRAGDKNQTEMIWMQRLEEDRRDGGECIHRWSEGLLFGEKRGKQRQSKSKIWKICKILRINRNKQKYKNKQRHFRLHLCHATSPGPVRELQQPKQLDPIFAVGLFQQQEPLPYAYFLSRRTKVDLNLCVHRKYVKLLSVSTNLTKCSGWTFKSPLGALF